MRGFPLSLSLSLSRFFLAKATAASGRHETSSNSRGGEWGKIIIFYLRLNATVRNSGEEGPCTYDVNTEREATIGKQYGRLCGFSSRDLSQMRTREEATGSLSNLWTSHVHGPEGSDEPSQPRIAAWIEKDEEEEGEE